MTADELKAHVRAYADEHLPGWVCSGVSFRVGELGAHATEELLVLSATYDPKKHFPSREQAAPSRAKRRNAAK